MEPLVAAYERAVAHGDAHWHRTLSAGVASLPERPAAAVVPRLSRPPAPARSRAAFGGRTQAGRRWRTATELAERIAEPDNLPDRPLLARLLFEVEHDHRPRHHFTSTVLLAAVPFADRVVDVLHDHACGRPPTAIASPSSSGSRRWRRTRPRARCLPWPPGTSTTSRPVRSCSRAVASGSSPPCWTP